MEAQAETLSQFDASERDALSLRGRFGKCIPEFSLRTGCTFRMALQAEPASQNIALEWDAVSGWHHLRKRRPILIIQNEKKELELRIVERLSSFSKTNL